ncbi:MAG: hypothetical protein COB66_05400 [Coxiella sp. (in: Bacteria)]|nr:MAG: hypothetical protein COB66_05400 [Coxiella sp. (in: g-proteobacteria)]
MKNTLLIASCTALVLASPIVAAENTRTYILDKGAMTAYHGQEEMLMHQCKHAPFVHNEQGTTSWLKQAKLQFKLEYKAEGWLLVLSNDKAPGIQVGYGLKGQQLKSQALALPADKAYNAAKSQKIMTQFVFNKGLTTLTVKRWLLNSGLHCQYKVLFKKLK